MASSTTGPTTGSVPGPTAGRALADRRAPLVARSARAGVAVVAVLAVLAVAVMGLLAWRNVGDARAGALDRTVSGLIDMRQGTAKTVGQGLADLGGPLAVAVMLGVGAVLAGLLRGGRGLVLIALGPPLAMVTTSLVLKPIVGRTKGGELAFPSGHTTAVASVAVAAIVLVLGLSRVPRPLRALAALALATLSVAVAASMVGLGSHYPTDTIGGLAVAVAVVLVVALAIDGWADLLAKRAPNHPVSRTEMPTEVLTRVRRWP